MKERSTSSNQSGCSGNLSESSTAAGTESPAVVEQQQPHNLLSSYNFMAPPIGGTIKCTTCLGNNIQGKVVAYDQQTKMLALSVFC